MVNIKTEFYAPSLGKHVQMNVLMPDCPDRNNPPKVMYLLHGLSDNYTKWNGRARVELHADGRNLCVVMPDGGTNFYSDSEGDNYWTFVSKDVPEFIEANFCVSHRREDTYVAGLSMGGYGALKMGLRCPEKYRRVFAMSSAVDFKRNQSSYNKNGLLFRDGTEHENDLKTIVTDDLKENKTLPMLHIYCGSRDFLYEYNADFDTFLTKNGVGHEFVTDEGYSHEWRYWEICLTRALDIINRDETAE